MTERSHISANGDAWDKRFLQLCLHVGAWSKEPRKHVGAVIVRPDRTIASVGFNGLPRGVPDTTSVLQDRVIKNLMTVHAEANAIVTAREPLHGYTIYVAPMIPCSQCAGLIIQSGIKRVVAHLVGDISADWAESAKISQKMFVQADITCVFFP